MRPLMRYPWPSSLAALSLIAWQLLLIEPALLGEFQPPRLLLQQDLLLYAVAAVLLLAVFDLRRFLVAASRDRARESEYRQQIGELFDSRRELGTRVRTYSDHADKLKMFISERLLEYIEYDEKFLHFKNIASEVRHNGVISYDKVQTALADAQRDCDAQQATGYREAAKSLLYLWDLLDLSTTDNIALAVTNRIYDCEEHYFQAQLNRDEQTQAPFEWSFQMSEALRRALLPITADSAALGLTGDWPKPGFYGDERFNIRLSGDCEMLGNENHMVLLIENLLNNALFYSQRKDRRNRHARVAISLARKQGDAELRVYNPGPHIKPEEKDRIYQLGFSSRRVREHHGKGLGLYFVDQIVRGFEGSIAFENLVNSGQRLILVVKLANGESHRCEAEIVDGAGRPLCRLADSDAQPGRRCEWPFAAPLSSIEVSCGDRRKPQVISGLGADQTRDCYDARDPLAPAWLLEIRNRKRSSKMVLQGLDRRGVEFTLRFPGAAARLDNQD